MADPMSAEVAWRRAAAAANAARMAFSHADRLVRENRAWLAIAKAWQHASIAATAAAEAAAEAEAASDGGPTDADLRGEVNHG